jgi:hypothetical protein
MAAPVCIGQAVLGMMAPIRVVTAGLPPLQADLVYRTLAGEPDLFHVATINTATSITDILRRHPADVVVVWAARAELVTAAVDSLSRYPHLAVVLLAGGGDTLIEARVHDKAYDSWPSGFINAVRRAGRRGS